MLAATFAVGAAGNDSLFRALWPALVAIGVIVLLQEAVVGLAFGVAAAALLLAGGDPLKALRLALAEHVFPAMQGPWRIGALVFTLVLGSFAGILERSGGFEAVQRQMLAGGKDGARRLLGGAYLVGLLCFFDGLASSLLTGRIARPLADRAGVSRERLSWVVDSTGSPVACVAFISTWIATQLSLIEQGLEKAPFPVEPYALFFQAVPANAYCLLTLLLVPLAIRTGYQPRAMRRFKPLPPETDEAVGSDLPRPWVVLVFAWSLGGMFEALGTTRHIADLLAGGTPVQWLPLVIFVIGSSMAFTTGSSWGTMGLLMPLALPATMAAAGVAGLSPGESREIAVMVIGAVFGGATLGDHCSPFSDTTIVSALASGCRTVDHVSLQLPFAGLAAATTGVLLVGCVGMLARRGPQR